MADAPAPAKSGSSFGFLTRKLGPLPVWVWGAAGFAAYWWYTRKGPGAKPATPPTPAQPTIVEVAGPPGDTGPPGPPGPVPPRRKRKPRPPVDMHGPPIVRPPAGQPTPTPPIGRPIPPPEPQPVPAVAPMTGGDIYGGVPTSNINGTIYDSGYPSAAELGGAYVPAG